MKSRSIKSMILAGLALAATAFAFAPATAQAGHGRSGGHCGSCNAQIFQRQVFTGCYDRCGNPIYRWVTTSHNCRSSHRSHRSHRDYGHRDYGHRSGHSHGQSRSYVRPSGFSINIQSFSSPSRRYCR